MDLRTGLTEEQAGQRLARDGFNELPRKDARSLFKLLADILHEPMLLLLLGGGLTYLAIGSFSDAVVLLVFAMFSIAITAFQERRTERILESLRDLSSPRALVIREGIRKRIPGREVVRDDLIVLNEGDRVPADANLMEADDLLADESLLTGESVPVRKLPQGQAADSDSTKAYAGSLIVRGTGLGKSFATGRYSSIGKIGEALRQIESEPSPLQRQTRKVIRYFALMAGTVSLLVAVFYSLQSGSWLDGILAAIALSMSLIPEEFPVVLTVFMAIGAWRISRVQVLTRRATAIETLGAATILCTDKTGTLTENRMRIVEARAWRGATFALSADKKKKLPSDCAMVIEHGLLACNPMPFDPMEKAFHDLADLLTLSAGGQHSKDGPLRTYGFRSEFPVMANAWPATDGKDTAVVALKGAPETVAALCKLLPEELADIREVTDEMGRQGMRVLGVARASPPARDLPEAVQSISFEFLGLVGLADPLRASVPTAVAECRSAGIKVVMITGDYPTTAKAVAGAAGIVASTIMTGTDIDALDAATLIQRVPEINIFARIRPDQKLRIVEAFKANGEIVAMTGDGVNDAPCLKAAHIGIAMGGRGTDVAREAASLILLNDDFGSIVATIRLGRRIYDNLRKAMGFIIAVHVPIAGLGLLPLLFGKSLILEPIHIALLEMIIDPVCTLAFESEADESRLMRRPPRSPKAPLFTRELVGISILQGLIVFVVTALCYLISVRAGALEDERRALVFSTLVIGVIGLILVDRSFSSSIRTALTQENATLYYVLLAVGCVVGSSLLVPAFTRLLHFSPFTAQNWLQVVLFGATALILLQGLKFLYLRRKVSQHPD